MDYPLKHAGDWSKLDGAPLFLRVASFLRTLRLRRRGRRGPRPALLPLRVSARLPAADETVMICITRDAAKQLPSLLAHYRRLGVARFAFLDDRSQDGTREALLAQPDVDLFGSDVGYKEARGGNVWRDMLVERYGRGRWYLIADSDEYLVFPGCEERPLSDFIGELARRGLTRAHAPMLDIYPDTPLGAGHEPAAPAAFPTEVSPLYDGADYTVGLEMFGTAVRGGPRRRLFGVDMRMSKFPLVLADRATQFAGGSIHGPLPLGRNFLPAHAVLLHHRFPPGAVEDFREIARRGSHSGKSAFYKRIVAHSGFSDDADLRYEGSRRFRGSQALVDEGFMLDLRARRPDPTARPAIERLGAAG